ncbi:acyltransferase family protein [Octadecabacter sp. 1_MG-2023]|uniref:acyltransferase family protein n=1 Tax=unclassified Octadecabacter TaxID=196158 RepID=UPI001C08A0C5|nr:MULTISPECIES: acyltransferase family protein [unclassified Octadecabacter]MBU2994004.1 acyltransferase [Octadecabacter sp. B2R22]MDO6736053.1 acyltransferase family protein [Octadecabacter sp. 1_MG-2023]
MVYRRDIDGLRAIAVLLVTVFHFDLLSVGKAGFIGVDVFFVISGFLITAIIAKDLEAGTFRFGTFLYRRVRRLYPAMVATLLLYLAASYFLLLPDMFRELALETVLSQLYVVNFYFWRSVNYFGLHTGDVPLLHMWSLAVEEQFYLIFPLFCLLVWKINHRWLLWAVVVVTVLSFLLGLVGTSWKPEASFYLLPTRAWELGLGGALALGVMKYPLTRQWVATFAGYLGLIVLGVGLYLHAPYVGVPGWFSLLPALAAAFLLIGGLNTTAPVTRFLSIPVMVWIGKISYPLYLVHWPVLILFKQHVPDFTLIWRLSGFGLSFLLAWGIYAAIEQPIRKGRVFVRPRYLLAAAGGSVAALVILGMTVFWQDGAPRRFPSDSIAALAFTTDTAQQFKHCENSLQNSAPVCLLGAPEAEPDMLVFGDSHANAFAHSIDIWLSREHRSAAFSFASGCLPVLNMGGARCVAQSDAAATFLKNNAVIETVVLVSIWRQPLSQGHRRQGRWTSGDELLDGFSIELRETVRLFTGLGKRVVIVDPFFAAPGDVPTRLAKNRAFGYDLPLDTSLADHRAEFESLYPIFDAAEDDGAVRISIIDPFCDDGICRGLYQDQPMFSDGNHLADGMSHVMSDVFEDAFATVDRDL